MPGQTHAAATALIKRKYGPGIHDQLSNESIAFGILKKVGKEKWGGSAFLHALRTARNRSTRPGGEQTALPTSQRQTQANAQVGCRIYHGVGGFTAFGAAATEQSDAAFGEMIKVEVDGLISDARKDLNIDAYGTPLGVLGRVNGDPGAGVTVTLDQAQGLAAWDQYGNRYLSPNQRVEFIDQADGTVRGTVGVIASVEAANRTQFDLTAAIAAIEDNDLVVREGTQATGAATTRALNGLEHLIDDTTTMPADGVAMGYNLDLLEGIDRSVGGNEYWRGNVLDINNANLAETHFQNMVYRIEERSGMYPDLILTHRSVQGAFQQLLVGDRRFVPLTFPGGFKAEALVYNAGARDIPIVVDRECPSDRAYFLNLDCISNYVLRDIEMIEETGSVLRQAAAGGDEWEFAFRTFFNLGTTQPNALGKLARIGGADEAFGIGAGRVYDF